MDNIDDMPLMMLLGRTHKEWQSYLKKAAVETGIPEPYRPIIMFLKRNPGASQSDLAKFCDKTAPSISSTIRNMISDGYITKNADNADQRFVKLYLTDKGESSVEKVLERIHKADRIITEAITRQKEEEMIKLLKLLMETIKREL